MSFGFQRDGLQYGTSGFGGSGSSGFGTQPFGGGGYPVYTCPTVQSGSDDPTTDLVSSVGETVLERDGLPIAARVWAERRQWHLVYRYLGITDVTSLREYWRLRRFRLLPDALDESTYWVVRWEQKDFDPRRLRGGQELYHLTFDLREVP